MRAFQIRGEFILGGVDCSETLLGFHLESIFIYFDLFSIGFSHNLFDFLEEMIEVNQATARTVNIHQAKIDVVKFDSTSNFGRKGKGDIDKTGNRQFEKNQCTFCKEEGH